MKIQWIILFTFLVAQIQYSSQQQTISSVIVPLVQDVANVITVTLSDLSKQLVDMMNSSINRIKQGIATPDKTTIADLHSIVNTAITAITTQVNTNSNSLQSEISRVLGGVPLGAAAVKPINDAVADIVKDILNILGENNIFLNMVTDTYVPNLLIGDSSTSANLKTALDTELGKINKAIDDALKTATDKIASLKNQLNALALFGVTPAQITQVRALMDKTLQDATASTNDLKTQILNFKNSMVGLIPN